MTEANHVVLSEEIEVEIERKDSKVREVPIEVTEEVIEVDTEEVTTQEEAKEDTMTE